MELTWTSRTSGVRIRSRISWAMRSPTFTVEIIKRMSRGRGRARDGNERNERSVSALYTKTSGQGACVVGRSGLVGLRVR